jgi:hypothetical protein
VTAPLSARREQATLWRIVGVLATPLGVVWALPNTLLGLGIGVAGLAVGAGISLGAAALWIASRRRIGFVRWCGGRVRLQHGGIEFIDSPAAPLGALTLGNARVYGCASPPEATHTLYGTCGVGVGGHERAHTLQAYVLGPLFLPVYLLTGGPTAQNPFEKAANRHALGTGSWWPG